MNGEVKDRELVLVVVALLGRGKRGQGRRTLGRARSGGRPFTLEVCGPVPPRSPRGFKPLEGLVGAAREARHKSADKAPVIDVIGKSDNITSTCKICCVPVVVYADSAADPDDVVPALVVGEIRLLGNSNRDHPAFAVELRSEPEGGSVGVEVTMELLGDHWRTKWAGGGGGWGKKSVGGGAIWLSTGVFLCATRVLRLLLLTPGPLEPGHSHLENNDV